MELARVFSPARPHPACTVPLAHQTLCPGPCRLLNSPSRTASWRCRALGGGDDEPIDIDALAARLAAEAARLKSELGFEGPPTSDDDLDVVDLQALAAGPPPPPPPPPLAPFGPETKAQEAEILAAVGDGGFSASEFELLQELGQISVQQVVGPGFPGGGGGGRTARAAMIAYTASFYSGMPFQDPVVTLMKEYIPGSKAIACNELQILAHLCGMPSVEDKWRAAAAPLARDPPIVELLGYFLAGSTERAQIADPTAATEAPDEDTIWVVQKWEGMAPLALYPAQQQTSGLGLGRLFGGNTRAEEARRRMLRAIAAGALNALGYVHDRGVVHGSVGSGSLLLNTFSDSEAGRLIVKIDNFGFSRQMVGPRGQREALYPPPIPVPAAEEDNPLALGQRGDLRQMAAVLLEATLGALADGGPSELTSATSAHRVLGEVFEWDVGRYREYVESEAAWGAAAAALADDDDAGWELIAALVDGSASATRLADGCRYCDFRNLRGG